VCFSSPAGSHWLFGFWRGIQVGVIERELCGNLVFDALKFGAD
jgi:hypothetical protein